MKKMAKETNKTSNSSLLNHLSFNKLIRNIFIPLKLILYFKSGFGLNKSINKKSPNFLTDVLYIFANSSGVISNEFSATILLKSFIEDTFFNIIWFTFCRINNGTAKND